jgi:hypothetical protein
MNDTKLSEQYPRFREYYVTAKKKETSVRKRYTKEEDALIYDLMAKGKPYVEIGKALDRSSKSVEMRAHHLRKKLREAGLDGQSEVMTKRKPRKRKQVAKRKARTKKTEPKIVYSGGAMFEERMGHMMLLGAVGAAGVWLVLILLIIGLVQNL